MPTSKKSTWFAKMRKYVKLTGLNFDNEIKQKEKIFLWILPCTLYFYGVIVFSRKWNLGLDIAYSLGLIAAASVGTVIRLRRSTFASILDMLENIDVSEMKDDNNLQSSLVKVTTGGNIACLLGITILPSFVIEWYFSGKPSGMPFNTMPDWLSNYSSLCFILQVITYCAAGQEYIMINTFKFCILLQLQVHFKHLRSNIENLLESSEDNFLTGDYSVKDTVSWIYLQTKLRNVVTYHLTLITVSNKTETTFNKSVLTNFVIMSLFICLSLFIGANAPLFSAEFWRSLCNLLTAFVIFSLDCYFSQQVITETEELFRSCYKVNFVGTDLRFHKGLMMLMKQSQKTVMFSIGNFAPLSIVTIVQMMKVTFSYFTFLQNMK